jgi:DNA-binding XRE family transcriptional regulator
MTIRNVTMDGRKYVLIPRKQWENFTRHSERDPRSSLKAPPPMPDGTYSLQHVRISLANKVTSRRKAAGITQAELAKLARVRVETISRLENGLHMPNSKTFDKIDRALTKVSKRRAA